MNQREHDIKILKLKTNNRELSNSELTHFKIFKMYSDMTRNELVNTMGRITNMDSYYYCKDEYINNFIFVNVWSGRASAIYTMSMIANYSKHKLKHVINTDDSILMVFKKDFTCNKW